ncbi:hypothetical protein A3Q56_08689, partial [Intoshia linei]
MIPIVASEIFQCWTNQDIPVQNNRNIIKRIRSVLQRKKLHTKCRDLFDVIPSKPEFKTPQDRVYYNNQK